MEENTSQVETLKRRTGDERDELGRRMDIIAGQLEESRLFTAKLESTINSAVEMIVDDGEKRERNWKKSVDIQPKGCQNEAKRNKESK